MFGSWGVITLWEAPHTVGDTVNISGTHATTIVNIMNILGAFSFVKLINISGTNATIINIFDIFSYVKLMNISGPYATTVLNILKVFPA